MDTGKAIGAPHKEWQRRPDDERFLSLEDAHAASLDRRQRSSTPTLRYRDLSVGYDESGQLFLGQGPTGIDPRTGQVRTNAPTWDYGRAAFTHYSFGRFAQHVQPDDGGSGISYLRNHPAPLVRMMVQYDASQKAGETMLLLTPESRSRREDGLGDIRAFTSPSYGRVWNHEVLERLIDITAGKGWKVPAASYASTDPKLASTIYDSDRSMFTFLVNEDRPITVGGETLYPMIGTGNSEVGDETLWAFSGLYRSVCDNRLLHGVGQVNAIRIIHRKGAPQRFAEEMVPAIAAFVDGELDALANAVRAAQAKILTNDVKAVQNWMEKVLGLNETFAAKAVEAAKVEEGAGEAMPWSVWAVANGITAAARSYPHTDTRLEFERIADLNGLLIKAEKQPVPVLAGAKS